MEKVPKNLQNDALADYLKNMGLERIHQGKVRDTWRFDKNQLLVVATDRISIFDFVLPALVPCKGEVLTALTHFWLTDILEGIRNHLIESEESYIHNAAYDLKHECFTELPLERCLVVQDLGQKLYPFEMIFRHHIGGSVYKDYLATGMAGGQQLTPNLPQWSKLFDPIFTPSTKEEVGHDINVDAAYYYAEMEKLGKKEESEDIVDTLIRAYKTIYSYAEQRGVLILDTKFEVAGETIVDEFGTPDSSRFALKEDWVMAMKEGRNPHFYDKQPVRDWGMQVPTPFKDKKTGQEITGINKLDPKDPAHVAFVHSLTVPEEIINGTTDRYLKIFKMITEQELLDYQTENLGI